MGSSTTFSPHFYSPCHLLACSEPTYRLLTWGLCSITAVFLIINQYIGILFYFYFYDFAHHGSLLKAELLHLQLWWKLFLALQKQRLTVSWSLSSRTDRSRRTFRTVTSCSNPNSVYPAQSSAPTRPLFSSPRATHDFALSQGPGESLPLGVLLTPHHLLSFKFLSSSFLIFFPSQLWVSIVDHSNLSAFLFFSHLVGWCYWVSLGGIRLTKDPFLSSSLSACLTQRSWLCARPQWEREGENSRPQG